MAVVGTTQTSLTGSISKRNSAFLFFFGDKKVFSVIAEPNRYDALMITKTKPNSKHPFSVKKIW